VSKRKLNTTFKSLEKIQKEFSLALNLPTSIRDKEGKLLAPASNPTKFWSLLQKQVENDPEITNALKEAFEICTRTGQPVIFKRFLDTYTFTIPVSIDNEVNAFYVGGLVRFGNPNLNLIAKTAIEYNLNEEELLEAYLEISLFSKERLQAAANLLTLIIKALSIK